MKIAVVIGLLAPASCTRTGAPWRSAASSSYLQMTTRSTATSTTSATSWRAAMPVILIDRTREGARGLRGGITLGRRSVARRPRLLRAAL